MNEEKKETEFLTECDTVIASMVKHFEDESTKKDILFIGTEDDGKKVKVKVGVLGAANSLAFAVCEIIDRNPDFKTVMDIVISRKAVALLAESFGDNDEIMELVTELGNKIESLYS